MDLKEMTVAILKQYDVGTRFSYLPNLTKASVLIPLCVKDEEIHVLMTLRSLELRTNAGDVCFPGGKKDPSDKNDVDTALREAEEELGLPADQVDVVCTLFPIMNKRGLLVTPVVGFIDASFSPCPNPAEVSAVFTAPLEFFLKETDHSSYSPAGMSGLLHSFLFRDPESGSYYQIWGLTAVLAILVSVLALRKKPEFEISLNSDNPESYFQHNLYKIISKL